MSAQMLPPTEALVSLPVVTRKRGRLLNGLIEAGCELLAYGSQIAAALTTSSQADALHDADLQMVRRIARRGAEESAALHGCRCWQRFRAIDVRAASAQQHDAREDGLIAQALGWLERLCGIVRGCNRSLERELTQRGLRRAL